MKEPTRVLPGLRRSIFWEEVFCIQKSIYFFRKEKKVYILSTFFGWMISCVCCRLITAFVPSKTWSTSLSQILFRDLMRIIELCSLFISWTENKLWPPLSGSRSFTPVQRTAWHLKHIIVLVTAFSSKRILMSFNLDSFLEFFSFPILSTVTIHSIPTAAVSPCIVL